MSLNNSSGPLIMGILNLTPDSFSDGGCYGSVASAVERGMEMVRAGADIIDIGGESTRPEAARVKASEQLRRVLDVIERLREQLPDAFSISIDTTLSEVARQAVARGAAMINDVSAGRDDPAILDFAAEERLPLVLMHMQGSPETMQQAPSYQDVVTEVMDFLERRIAVALRAGVMKEALILDPGIGFGKTRQHNLSLLGALQRLAGMGYPLLLGVSRKRFMGSICAVEEPAQLGPATCACTALGVMAGVRIFRVHDVWQNRQAADVVWAIQQSQIS
jgi:dihydropteroate synthase